MLIEISDAQCYHANHVSCYDILAHGEGFRELHEHDSRFSDESVQVISDPGLCHIV